MGSKPIDTAASVKSKHQSAGKDDDDGDEGDDEFTKLATERAMREFESKEEEREKKRQRTVSDERGGADDGGAGDVGDGGEAEQARASEAEKAKRLDLEKKLQALKAERERAERERQAKLAAAEKEGRMVFIKPASTSAKQLGARDNSAKKAPAGPGIKNKALLSFDEEEES